MARECKHPKWNIDAKNVGTCQACGEVRQYPTEKGEKVILLKRGHLPEKSKRRQHFGVNPYQRHVYYEANKEAIIRDLLTKGRTATRIAWKFPSGSSLFAVEKRWLTAEQIEMVDKVTHTPVLQTTSTPVDNGALPHLPEFSMTWPPDVQFKWLEIYEKLIDKQEVQKE